MPVNNSPVTDVTSPDITCNVNPTPATTTVPVAAGDMVGFDLDNTLYHQGPAAIYLGQYSCQSVYANFTQRRLTHLCGRRSSFWINGR